MSRDVDLDSDIMADALSVGGIKGCLACGSMITHRCSCGGTLRTGDSTPVCRISPEHSARAVEIGTIRACLCPWVLHGPMPYGGVA